MEEQVILSRLDRFQMKVMQHHALKGNKSLVVAPPSLNATIIE